MNLPVVADNEPVLNKLVENQLIVQESAAKFAHILRNAESVFVGFLSAATE